MSKGKFNDRALVEMLYDRYEQRIYQIAFSVLNDSYQAEDTVSETFIKLIKNVHHIWTMDEKKMEAYITKLARNTAVDQYRRNKREMSRIVSVDTETDRETEISNNPIEEVIASTGSKQRVREMVDLLPDKYRDVVICMALHELSGRETALMLNLSESAVRKRYERAKKLLKKKVSVANAQNEDGKVNGTGDSEISEEATDGGWDNESSGVFISKVNDIKIRRCL